MLQSSVNGLPWGLRSQIKRIPGIAQAQQWIVGRVLSKEPFLHTINAGPAKGLTYPIVLPDDKQIWTGMYEQKFCETLAAAVKPGSSCYDIGGYRGFFAGVMACQGASSVHVFEPLPVNTDQVRRMASLNPQLRISVHQVALADVPGETSFAIMPAASMGKLTRSGFDTRNPPQNIITVAVETIDQMITQHRIPPADLIKIDVEGAEILVLQGATKLIRDHHPTFYIEAHSRGLAEACLAFLQPHGYALRVLETGKKPDFVSEPEVCHIEAIAAPAKTSSARGVPDPY